MTFAVFLSSLTAKLPSEARNLRERIFHSAGNSILIYVDELLNHRPAVRDSLALADELLRRVSEAQCFLCVLAGSSHGEQLPVEDAKTSVSYFEVELFAAALQRKPIHILVHNSFDPVPELRSLLEILRFAIPDWTKSRRLNDNEVVSEAARVADGTKQANKKRPFVLFSVVDRLAQAFYAGRGRMNRRVEFLGGQRLANLGLPNLQLASNLIKEVKQRGNHEERLSRLWLAIRELNTPSLMTGRNADALVLLEDALEEWSGAGAWYGLNADIHLGCVAALNTTHQLRERRKAIGALPHTEQAYPAGALASAKFNVAKHLISFPDRRDRLKDAMCDINLALQSERQDCSGLLAVRASINRKLGRVFDAAADLESSLQIRRRLGITDDELGGTFSELGFVYLYSFRLRKGRKLCEEGVSRLRAASARPEDLARALRKLSVAYAVTGSMVKARCAIDESRDLAVKANAHDQLR